MLTSWLEWGSQLDIGILIVLPLADAVVVAWSCKSDIS